jgi:ubiquitin-conjugating enzyme E2 N
MLASKRLTKELDRIKSQKEIGDVKVSKYNSRYLLLQLPGPKDTPYDGGVFYIEFFFPDEYPSVPPKARFLTKIYHPNIDMIGRICLDILKDRWSAALQITTIALSISALMACHNLEDPLDMKVAQHFKTNPSEAYEKARYMTKKYATFRQDIGLDINDFV